MHPGSTPHNVSSVLSFQQATSTNLQLACSTQRYPLHGGISKDGKVCWLYSGSILEVVSCNTRNCLAAWNFGNFSHDAETIIQCVSEFWTGDSLKLLVGLKTGSTSSNGLLCVLHIGLSKVVKAIEIPFPVTSVECVTSLLGNDFLVWSFSEQLSCFYGIIAAGTEGGHVYLIDMCLDTYDLSDETFPNSLYYITPETDAVQARHEALSQRQVLSMELGTEAFSDDDLFNYQGNDENVVKQFNTDDICVTCLKYMSRNGLLAVGFSFGCFQLWRLAVPFLEYSSHVDDSGDAPITHITYQEPENDPKFFTYIWVARGLQAFASDNGYVANISLYQLTFNKRVWQANEEYFYEEMTSIGIRLEHNLSCDPLMPSKTFSSNVISCFTLEDPDFVPSRIFDGSHEEVCSSPDLSLSVFVWRAIDGSKNGTTSYHLSIFDMNRWYHLQMPSTLRTLRSSGVCPFMAFCSLDEVVDSTVDDELLNIYINPSTVRKFICDPLAAQEQFFYPASLQFDVLCLMESGLLSAKYLGMQRQVLNTIQKLGPSCLIEPTEVYKMCLFVGLVHRSQENAPQSFSIVGFQREALLSLCLEYHMVNVILKCIDEWAEGEFTAQKCTLKYLLDWSWNKVVQIKEAIDSNTKHFFDWSGLPIDDTCIQGLHRCLQKFTYLAQIFHKFIASSVPTTENGIEELKQKLDALQLLSHHLKAVIWFVEAGLLPENDELANDTPGLYKYPRLNLFEEFSKRRSEIKQLNSDLKPNELLMIDGLIANMAPSVCDVWKQDGGDELYPPPSISALLYIYLLEDVSLITKHCVVGYFFLDLASLGEEDNSKLAAKVTAFSQIFSVPTETMNLITGFWFLDHKDFEVAFYSLAKSSVFGQWQHRQVIKSLLYQEEYKLALQYLAVKKPPLSSPEEIKLKLTTFLFNGMTAQAVEFYRSCCNQTNAEDLISHIFLGCQQRKILGQLMKLPLTEAEEKWLENYLMASPELNSKEALVVYYLQRARYVDAIRLNEKLKSKDMSSLSEREKNMTSTRNIIVRNCLKLLPEIQRQYLHESNLIPKKRINRVTRPKPLSTVVTKSTGPRVMSQSTLILAIMEKMDEVERLNNSANDSRSFGEESFQDIAVPFISAPFTPQKTALPNFSRFASEKSLMKDTTSSQSASKHKSILLSQKYTSARDEHFGYLEQPARRKPKYVSAEALSVLQTPVIQRKSTLQSKMTSPRPTPQSILKVRQMSARSPSFNMSRSMDKDSPGLRNSGRSSQSAANNSLLLTPTATSVKRTSKSLRFAEPASRNFSPNSSNGSYTSMSALLSKTAPRTEISAADRHQVMDNILALLDNNNVEAGREVTEMDTDGVEEEEEEEEEDTGSFIEEEEDDDYEEEHRRKMHVDDDDDEEEEESGLLRRWWRQKWHGF
ncbi:protein ELYS isoform X1 [Octopus sinensis]|uniref:Protein ELYS isoform X1 n=1 Tax=Octopus sinensis TaxID=2607531 RepID=A0A6P7TQT6_9MOLL|nr:protein ELYS isoform X1 [Octopus sinensis]